jgi:hypothetical protein
METHTAWEMLVLPVVRGVGGALAFFALLKVLQLGFSLVVQHLRHRRRAAAETAGPYRLARPRSNPANGRVADISR